MPEITQNRLMDVHALIWRLSNVSSQDDFEKRKVELLTLAANLRTIIKAVPDFSQLRAAANEIEKISKEKNLKKVDTLAKNTVNLMNVLLREILKDKLKNPYS